MATVVEAPQEYRPGHGDVSLFLAGGITGCPDWQAEAVPLLSAFEGAVLNPRQPRFDVTDPAAGPEQVAWEYRHLQRASVILFWFPDSPTSPQPIALYELGFWVSPRRKPLAVGAHPDYVRRQDVLLQLGHVRPDLQVHDSLQDTCAEALRLCRPPTTTAHHSPGGTA